MVSFQFLQREIRATCSLCFFFFFRFIPLFPAVPSALTSPPQSPAFGRTCSRSYVSSSFTIRTLSSSAASAARRPKKSGRGPDRSSTRRCANICCTTFASDPLWNSTIKSDLCAWNAASRGSTSDIANAGLVVCCSCRRGCRCC